MCSTWRLAALALLAIGPPAPAQEAGAAPPPLRSRLPEQSARGVEYRIAATLLEDGRTLEGEVIVTWRNDAEGPAGDLYWHVYNNAWSGRDSVWMREARMFGDDRLPRDWGSTTIQSVSALTDAGETPLEWDWVAEEGSGDRTVMRCDLPQPVARGGTVTAKVVFRAVLPPAFRRSGGDGQQPGGFLHAAQWFPKLGVFEEVDGALQWNCLPYHYLTEFYSDYGNYRVVLTLPDRYLDAGRVLKVAATGTLVSMDEGEGTITCTFEAQDVHDFAWTADPDFLVFQRDFDPAKWRDPEEEQRVARALGRSVEEVRPRPCTMFLMLQPEHREYEDEYLDALEKAIYYFGLWYGAYPYETISLIDPAHNAAWTGGMEYPRLITGGVSKGKAARTLDPEGVTVHEFGHQFWYGLVGNDEFRHAWLDEGFNTHSTQRVLRAGWEPPLATYKVLGSEHYGRSLAALPDYGPGDGRGLLSMQRVVLPAFGPVPAAGFEFRRRTALERWLAEVPAASYLPAVVRDPVWGERRALHGQWVEPLAHDTFRLLASSVRRTNAYMRPAMMLETMAGLMGEERWTRTLRAYHETWRFRHPRPEDFLAAVREYGAGALLLEDDGTGIPVDWDSFWDQAVNGNDTLDFAVTRVVNQRTVTDPSELPAERGMPAGESSETWDVIVEVRRRAGFRVPVEIRIEWDDQTTETHAWDGEGYWWRFREEASPRRAVKVVVDPHRRLLLDQDWSNNSRLAEPAASRSRRLGIRALLWAQQVLHYYGGVG